VLPTLGVTGAALPAAAAAASSSDSGSSELGAVAAITQNFRPDLALKQELHDIKVNNAVEVCPKFVGLLNPRWYCRTPSGR
jgi:hypothetical protein